MGQDVIALDSDLEQARLCQLVEEILAEATQQGASAAEVGVSLDAGLSTSVRLAEVETVQFHRDQGFGITVYFGQRKGSASTTDGGRQAVVDTVRAACEIAKYTSEDPCSGLADASLMAAEVNDLDLSHPWAITPEQAIEQALVCEAAGRGASDKIINSEGATVSSSQGCRVYGNSNGFIGSYVSSRHGASCVLIGQDGEDMQRDYWYSQARRPEDLESMASIGQHAAERTLSRLNPQKLTTGKMPVLFSADVAGGLLAHFINAISGSSLYREASFLLDQLGQPVFPEWVHIHEQPQLIRGLGSAAFDQDGLATFDKDFITDGVLANYILSSYSGRKLDMPSTANAGGVHNLRIDSNAGDLNSLLKQMDRGLLVTELMGQGVNIVTGDYSRGAAGFWVENGEIQYPVAELTIAGNLREIYNQLLAVGSDRDERGNIWTGSWLVDEMMVAGDG